MAVTAARVSVTDAATKLDTADGDNRYMSRVIVANPAASGVTVDLGGSTVTSGAGYELAPGEQTPPLQLEPGDDLYAIAPAVQSVTLQVLELGV